MPEYTNNEEKSPVKGVKFVSAPWVAEVYADFYGELKIDIQIEGENIAKVYTHSPRYTEEEIKANAYLIAAAPDMYHTLARCLKYIENDECTHGRTFGEGVEVRQVMAKARGEK